jgi:hypothetical protein
MDQIRDTWRLTVALLEDAELLDADRRMIALAHLGAAIVLFSECDAAMAEALARVIERGQLSPGSFVA